MSETANNAPYFDIQRIFIKDVSYEAPHTPQIFSEEWKPEVQLNIETKNTALNDNLYEIILSVTATATSNGKSAFLIEIHQAGVFTINNLPDEQLQHMLNAYCPNILLPFARQAMADMVVQGGFPPLLLAPVNFDALFAEHLKNKKNEK